MALHVEKQGRTVGTETWTANLAFLTVGPGGRVTTNRIHLSVGRHAADVLVFITVLDHDQVTPRGDTEIVALVHHRSIAALEEQLEATRRCGFTGLTLSRARLVAPDLAEMLGATIGTGEIAFILAPPDPFAARKVGRPGGNAASSEIGIGGFRVIEVDPFDIDPLARLDGRALPVADVEARTAAHGERLELAAFNQLTGDIRQEAVEEGAGVLVFGLVGDQRTRIDGHGLVAEAPHCLERDRLDQARGLGGHFKDIAMLDAGLLTGIGFGLLAGQPAAPRRRTAGAIIDRADQRQIFLFHRQRLGIENNVAGAADMRIAVLVPVVNARAINQIQPGIVEAEGRLLGIADAQFVIAHQDDAAIGFLETGHAVKVTRNDEPVAHRLTRCGDDVIGEAPGQIEQALRIGL